MVRKILPAICAAWASLGMVCTGPDGPDPTLPEIRIEAIRLQLMDPENGRPGASLAWSWPDSERASYFEIYQALDKDSLGVPVAERLAPESTTALLRLPDSSRPLVLYYGVRAVYVEQTGQKLFGKSIPIDSLTVNPSVLIMTPPPRSFQAGRMLEVDVSTSADAGIVLRQSLYEKGRDGWALALDTCLPMQECGKALFGSAKQQDVLILQNLAPGDTLECLYCVLGNESFEDNLTGRRQSLGCTRFFRTAP